MHPVLLRLGPFHLPTYGVLTAGAYLAAILWLKRRAPAMNLSENNFWSLIYGIVIAAIIGGKLLYIIVERKAFLSGELSLIKDFRYGFVFYGGLLAACLAALALQKRLEFKIARVADYFAAALPLGHAVGRLGCLASGCCYGKPAPWPWGVALGGDPASTTPHFLWGIKLHPTQIYESLGNLAIFGAIACWILPKIENDRIKKGTGFLAYLALYSILRFTVEFWRFDERGFLWALSTSQWLALAAILAAGATLAVRGRQ